MFTRALQLHILVIYNISFDVTKGGEELRDMYVSHTQFVSEPVMHYADVL